MSEPVRKRPREPEHPGGEPELVSLLARYVRQPDGSLELRYTPLTPEDFLNAQPGDKWLQGREHTENTHDLFEVLRAHFSSAPDVVVTSDLQYRFGRGLARPCPDVAVLRGVRRRDIKSSADVRKLGVVPCLVIEVVSPGSASIRHVDEDFKVRFYQQMGIPEYLLAGLPRRGGPVRLWGYRLDAAGRYRPVEPDRKGRLFSETTHLEFAVSPGGDRIDVYDGRTGRRLLRPLEAIEDRDTERDAREAAERRAAEEAAARELERKAREAAEREVARLRAELERLRKTGRKLKRS